MADQKISQFAVASAVADADLMAVVQGGTTKRSALSVLSNYILSKVGGLTTASGLGDTDVLGGMQSTNLRKFALSDIAAYVAGKLFVYTDVSPTSATPIHFVSDDASAVSATPWVPVAGVGANPTLGTGGYIRGRVRKLGKEVTFRFTVQCSPNAFGMVRTDMASNVSASRITRSAAHGYVNGMAVIPSGLGATVISLPSLMPDGSYFIVNVGGGGGNDLQLSQTPGGSIVPLTGLNATNITLNAVAFNRGTGGFYRLGLPYPVSPAAQFDQAVIGDGHIFMNQTIFGLGPGDFKDVHFHVAGSVDSSVCGIVVGTNLAPSSIDAGADGTNSAYVETNHTTDLRTLNETGASSPPTQADVASTRQYLITMRRDVTAAMHTMTADNVGPQIPANWGPNWRLIGKMSYETV